MPDLTPEHPAVEAAMKSTALDTLLIDLRPRLDRRKRVAHLLARFITAALPHLTADDLRNTPAGRALKAEAWEEAVLRYARGSAETRRVLASVLPNPYRDGDA